MITYLSLELKSPQPLPCLIDTCCSHKGLTSTEELNNRKFPPSLGYTGAAKAQKEN